MVNEERLGEVQRRISALPAEYLGNLPHDPALESMVFDGKAVSDLGESTAKELVRTVLETLGG